ncbi:SHOCT domain-containing protein [Demequina sp. SYSU T00192]|uniref:SHOCT domain-containing protein n=1 Tax=Demequina litoralis TaxID=3051660 RepID=A0ABT8G771_9MICO|nr:SHOCT domain-containing protein [Demequina sp. SYSU T00192]MDN4474847.1 SHOCT domain-containing protein [Demequina sp. SYSU T00192]
MGRPGLVGTMARTAVIAGTAQAVGGRVSRRQNQRWSAQEQQAQQEQYAADQQAYQAQQSQAQMAAMQAELAQLQQQQAPAQVEAAPAGGGGDLMGELQKLAQMKEAGILSDAEFAAAKAKLLG